MTGLKPKGQQLKDDEAINQSHSKPIPIVPETSWNQQSSSEGSSAAPTVSNTSIEVNNSSPPTSNYQQHNKMNGTKKISNSNNNNNHNNLPLSPNSMQRRRPQVIAVEEDDDDIIPGPPTAFRASSAPVTTTTTRKPSSFSRLFSGGSNANKSPHKLGSSQQSNGSRATPLNMSGSSRGRSSPNTSQSPPPATTTGHRRVPSVPESSTVLYDAVSSVRTVEADELDLSGTEHHIRGKGILASRTDLDIPAEEFAAGCNLLQAAAAGNLRVVQEMLQRRPEHVNFRDYDRRTALHVAASENHLDIVKYLVEVRNAKINRSDRWGGSPLDDAHRHRHQDVVVFLRQHGAVTGSGNQSTNLITAAADGDLDEVQMLLSSIGENRVLALVNKGDYDKRTPLHLAASEGHSKIVLMLCNAGANVNAQDRWGSRPLDDAIKSEQKECSKILESFGAKKSPSLKKMMSAHYDASDLDSSQAMRERDNLKVDFNELEMVDRIGSGAFGEIFKCRWRGTMVAAKCIKSAKIRKDWINKKALEAIANGADVDEAMKQMDEAEMDEGEIEEALDDFRQEISVLKSLRHPHIVLLLAFSTTENYEVMISELMECSLLDVFKAHQVHGTRLPRRTAISYAIQLARGMNYLHQCKPPIVHRDLKPANLLLDHTGVLKISDFGLAKVRPDPKKKQEDGRFMTGETGSYRFMAPEVFRHEDYNETVDVYSYAMILFYLLDGRPPWPTLPGLEAVRRASDEGDRPIIPRHWDQRLLSLLMECWDENPNARPPFNQILETLDTYSRDVFHTDITKSGSATSTATRCNCAIM